MRKPKIGEKVLYHLTPSEQRGNLGSEVLPAIVVAVNERGLPNLKIFTNNDRNTHKVRIPELTEPGETEVFSFFDAPVPVAPVVRRRVAKKKTAAKKPAAKVGK